jgi:hypothetical protein
LHHRHVLKCPRSRRTKDPDNLQQEPALSWTNPVSITTVVASFELIIGGRY